MRKILVFLMIFLIWFLSGDIFQKYYVPKLNPISSYEFLQDSELWKLLIILQQLKTEFYSEEDISSKLSVDNIIKNVVSSLGDEHTEYMNKEETKEFNEVLSWNFEWIWTTIEKTNSWILIKSVLPNSPAEKSNLKDWDIITKVDWKSIIDLSIIDSISKIKGPDGSEVSLTISRNWSGTLEKTVTRWVVDVPTTISEIFSIDNKKIGYLSLSIFWDKSIDDFENSLKKLKDTDWLIIDLRDNWWGYLNSAIDIISHFVEPNKVVVTMKYKDKTNNIDYTSFKQDTFYDKPLIVLINWNSASASEITAWALKDYKKAIIVWDTSYWKGSVQEPIEFIDWSLLKVTIAKWFTPKDVNIDKKWIEPDVKVSLSEEDIINNYDKQLEKSKEIMKYFINNKDIDKTINKFIKKG